MIVDHKIKEGLNGQLTFKDDQLIVYYSTTDEEKGWGAIFQKIYNEIKLEPLICPKCPACNGMTELWEGAGLHEKIESIIESVKTEAASKGIVMNTTVTTAVSTGIRTSSTVTRAESEDKDIVISLNFEIDLPENKLYPIKGKIKIESGFKKGVEPGEREIVVAVLDTGVADDFPSEFLWTEAKGEARKRNFLNQTGDITDDSSNQHGTLVNAYILDEFRKAGKEHLLRLMNLKVLDKDGKGDLLSMINAIQYVGNASENGINIHIINSSMGFYGVGGKKDPFLDTLVNNYLKQNQTLFVTAAGNVKNADNTQDADDSRRQLDANNFYMAFLGNTDGRTKNNIIAVTTVGRDNDEIKVSPGQHISSKHLDYGVLADDSFRFPFPQVIVGHSDGQAEGSSFAAAIATGVIGAHYLASTDGSQLSGKRKAKVISEIAGKIGSFEAQSLNGDIKNGRYIDRSRIHSV